MQALEKLKILQKVLKKTLGKSDKFIFKEKFKDGKYTLVLEAKKDQSIKS